MKTILVTGGAGFIGSHLCELLLYKGNNVICLDSLSTGSRDNIEHLFDVEGFIFIHGEVEDCISHIVMPVDQIYHLACPASPKAYQKNPIKTLHTCYYGTHAVLTLASINKSKVLFTSTSEVYGDPLVHPQPEEYFGNVNTIGPRSIYDEGKRVAETLCYEYSKLFPISIARIFNTYGPRLAEKDGRVVSNFIMSAIKPEFLLIYGDGMQTRSLCYVSDTVDALMLIMDKGEFGPYNVGTDQEITILELAGRIMHYTAFHHNYSLGVMHLPGTADDPKQRKPVLKRINELGWAPKVSLEHGLMKTIKYFNERTRSVKSPA